MAKKFSDVFKRYKTYDDSNGRGSVKEWQSAFEAKMSKDEADGLLNRRNPLSVFELTELPTLSTLRKLYIKLMMKHHPDRGGDTHKCKEIIAAFVLLEQRCK